MEEIRRSTPMFPKVVCIIPKDTAMLWVHSRLLCDVHALSPL